VFSKFQVTLFEGYRYREVLLNILSQHLKVKYKRTALGYVWSLLNPLMQLAVLSVVFSQIPKLGVPNYTLYLFAGLMPWTFLSNSLLSSSTSLLESENFIKKVYLPKIIFPLSRVLLVGIDFLFSLVALSVIGFVVGFHFHATLVLLPLAVLLMFLFVLGIALLASVATVYFRDVQYLTGVFLNLLYFLTPVIYPLSALPEQYRVYLKLNPVAAEIVLFQKLIYFGQLPTAQEWMIATSISIVAFLGGLSVLMATEDELVFRM
jgi:ABC-type polysaccharide/polyol phosphate export permease